jgi:hypothetical protein
MQLNIYSREYYFLDIPTDPPITAADASFDDGQTWVPGESFDNGFRWLIQGPNSDLDEAGAVIIRVPTMVPLVRYGSPPQRRVEEAPAISLTS